MKSLVHSLTIFFVLVFNLHAQWVQTTGTPEGSGITGMIYMPLPYEWILVSTGSISGGQQGGIRRSTDGGATWVNLIDCYIARTIILGQNSLVFASIWNYPAQNEGIFRYSANGWEPIYIFASTGNNIFSLLNPVDSLIYAGTRTGILRSTNYGANFSFSNTGLPANSWVWDIAADSNNIIAAATTNGLFISTNLGDSWQQATGIPAGDTVTSLLFFRTQSDNNTNGKLLAGTDDGIVAKLEEKTGYLSVGLFSQVDPNEEYIEVADMEELDRRIWASTHPRGATGGGTYESTNEGESWVKKNDGLPTNPKVSSLTELLHENNISLLVGFFNNANNGAPVYKRTIPIGIQQFSSEVPKGFSLFQNYPNPFNPLTNIEFSLPGSSFVKLVIYDMLGSEIETLVSDNLKPGSYKVDWNAANYTSGVYFYKLTAGDYTETKKMILIK